MSSKLPSVSGVIGRPFIVLHGLEVFRLKYPACLASRRRRLAVWVVDEGAPGTDARYNRAAATQEAGQRRHALTRILEPERSWWVVAIGELLLHAISREFCTCCQLRPCGPRRFARQGYGGFSPMYSWDRSEAEPGEARSAWMPRRQNNQEKLRSKQIEWSWQRRR